MLDVTVMPDNVTSEDEGIFSKIDDTWMLNEDDSWKLLQDSIKSLSEILVELEEHVQEGYDDLSSKINGIEKNEVEKTETLLQNFITRWETKCKETENLRVSLKRATHESTRINDEYHEMEESVSKMRQQFGMAIDSSVTEIEELAICNSSLSERIQDLESKIRRGDKAFKQNAKDNLSSLRQIITLTDDEEITVKTIRNKLNREADKIDRMIIVEDLFAVDENEANSNLAEKSQQMVDAISQGLVETLKRELAECRNIVDTQKQRIKGMEREKEEFLQNQLAAKNDGVNEMNELLSYLRKSILQRKPETYGDNNEVPQVKRNFNMSRKLVFTLQNGIDKSYKQVANKSGNIIDMKDTIRELNDNLKEYAGRIDSLTEERDFYKIKNEQLDNQYRLNNDELTTIHNRLKAIDTERKALFDENLNLKSGKENIQDFCSNLTGENDKLLDKLKMIQKDRDRTFEDLQEQLERTNNICHEKNEIEQKSEILEHAVLKLRREYQDQTREVNILSKENEDLKRSIQDMEQERHKIRRNVKAVETGNQDLEDQLFQLKSELQKQKLDNSKLKQTSEENAGQINESNKKVKLLEKIKSEAKQQLVLKEKELKDSEENLKSVKTSLKETDEITNKKKSLLGLYEKLMIKLLSQRKSILQNIPDEGEQDEHPSALCSTLSLEYKNESEIESNFLNTTHYVDKSYDRITSFINDKTNQFNDFSRQFSECMSDIESYDSCYSTENDESVPYLPRTRPGGRKGLKALKTNTNCNIQPGSIDKLKRFIKESKKKIEESNEILKKNILSNSKLTFIIRKNEYLKRIVKKLKQKIKTQNKEIKILKLVQLVNKQNESESYLRQQIEGNEKKPVYSEGVTTKIEEILNKLDETQTELKNANKISNKVKNESQKSELIETIQNLSKNLKDISKILSHSQTDLCVCYANNNNNIKRERKNDPEQLSERFEVIQEQRQYMLDHMTFTNKRLEVLLDALKGKEQNKVENEEIPPPIIDNPYTTKRVLKRVRDSFKSDENSLKRVVSILELTKAISVTNLTELGENKAIDNDHREMIVLVKDLNENMDSVLREARSNISTTTHRNTNNTLNRENQQNTDVEQLQDVVPKSVFIKKENELKTSLESAQKKVEDLSNFLARRESELKERDEIIAQLNQEYEQLKAESLNKNDINIQTRDRIIHEYKEAKFRLEQENKFLQHVVKELRDELLNFQSSYRKEEETQKHLEEFIEELQLSKQSLETSLDKMAYELDIVQKDREQLIYSMQRMNMHHNYNNNWYQAPSGFAPPPYQMPNQYPNALRYNSPNTSQNYNGGQMHTPYGHNVNERESQYVNTSHNNPQITQNTPQTVRKYNGENGNVSSSFNTPQTIRKYNGESQYINISHNTPQTHRKYNGEPVHGSTLYSTSHNPVYTQEYQSGHQNMCAYGECDCCEYSDPSQSTVLPYSEDDVIEMPTCDEYESLPSDREDAVSSAESQTTSTSSRVARKIKTVEASEVIKANNRPLNYAKTEKNTAQPLRSPRTSDRGRGRSVDSDTASVNSHSSVNSGGSSNRVRGRREQSRSSNRPLSQDSYKSQRSESLRSPEPNFNRSDIRRFSYDSRRKQYETMQGFENNERQKIYNTNEQYARDGIHSRSDSYNQDSQVSGYETGNDINTRNRPNLHNQGFDKKQVKVRYENIYRNPVVDIDTAIERASLEAERRYLEEQRNLQSISTMDSSFLNSNFDSKKKKKKFLGFGKK